MGRQAWGSIESFVQPQGRSLPAAGLHGARWLHGGWDSLIPGEASYRVLCALFCYCCLSVCCLFNKDANKHSNKLCRVQTEMTIDRVLAHGGHCITSTLLLSIVNR